MFFCFLYLFVWWILFNSLFFIFIPQVELSGWPIWALILLYVNLLQSKLSSFGLRLLLLSWHVPCHGSTKSLYYFSVNVPCLILIRISTLIRKTQLPFQLLNNSSFGNLASDCRIYVMEKLPLSAHMFYAFEYVFS